MATATAIRDLPNAMVSLQLADLHVHMQNHVWRSSLATLQNPEEVAVAGAGAAPLSRRPVGCSQTSPRPG
jgi:hypothetical protein